MRDGGDDRVFEALRLSFWFVLGFALVFVLLGGA